jgi:hypothetical protein
MEEMAPAPQRRARQPQVDGQRSLPLLSTLNVDLSTVITVGGVDDVAPCAHQDHCTAGVGRGCPLGACAAAVLRAGTRRSRCALASREDLLTISEGAVRSGPPRANPAARAPALLDLLTRCVCALLARCACALRPSRTQR